MFSVIIRPGGKSAMVISYFHALSKINISFQEDQPQQDQRSASTEGTGKVKSFRIVSASTEGTGKVKSFRIVSEDY
jgi:hypothetical protein